MTSGHRHTSYSANEIDAIAAYSPDTDKCYLIPAREVAGRATLSLRLGPTLNNQARAVRWAQDYEIAKSIALIDAARGQERRAENGPSESLRYVGSGL